MDGSLAGRVFLMSRWGVEFVPITLLQDGGMKLFQCSYDSLVASCFKLQIIQQLYTESFDRNPVYQ